MNNGSIVKSVIHLNQAPMKNLLMPVLAALLLNSLGTSNMLSTNSAYSYAIQEKVSVKPEDLPEAVKKTLNSGSLEGWKVISAFQITNVDKTQYYDINLQKGEESVRIKLDKEGKLMG